KKTVGTNHRQALVALQHHERMDGSGYPHGIPGDEIDYFSRIVAVADVFHAMTSKRSYRDPSPFYEVLQQMNNDTFGVLDPTITKVFVERIMDSLLGNTVLLTNGMQGKIVLIHNNDPIHPLIKVDDDYIDLRKRNGLHIERLMS